MRLPMMKLGTFTFSLDTAAYQSLVHKTAFTWASQSRLNKTPQQQYTGPGPETISLPGYIMPAFAGGLRQIDDMRREAARGEPLLMVDGDGRICGYWVLKSIQETQKEFLPGGVPQRVDFTLELAFYGVTV